MTKFASIKRIHVRGNYVGIVLVEGDVTNASIGFLFP